LSTAFRGDRRLGSGPRLVGSLRPGGALVVGSHEEPALGGLEPWPDAPSIWRRR
jgi:hypothetical protein